MKAALLTVLASFFLWSCSSDTLEETIIDHAVERDYSVMQSDINTIFKDVRKAKSFAYLGSTKEPCLTAKSVVLHADTNVGRYKDLIVVTYDSTLGCNYFENKTGRLKIYTNRTSSQAASDSVLSSNLKVQERGVATSLLFDSLTATRYRVKGKIKENYPDGKNTNKELELTYSFDNPDIESTTSVSITGFGNGRSRLGDDFVYLITTDLQVLSDCDEHLFRFPVEGSVTIETSDENTVIRQVNYGSGSCDKQAVFYQSNGAQLNYTLY